MHRISRWLRRLAGAPWSGGRRVPKDAPARRHESCPISPKRFRSPSVRSRLSNRACRTPGPRPLGGLFRDQRLQASSPWRGPCSASGIACAGRLEGVRPMRRAWEGVALIGFRVAKTRSSAPSPGHGIDRRPQHGVARPPWSMSRAMPVSTASPLASRETSRSSAAARRGRRLSGRPGPATGVSRRSAGTPVRSCASRRRPSNFQASPMACAIGLGQPEGIVAADRRRFALTDAAMVVSGPTSGVSVRKGRKAHPMRMRVAQPLGRLLVHSGANHGRDQGLVEALVDSGTRARCGKRRRPPASLRPNARMSSSVRARA